MLALGVTLAVAGMVASGRRVGRTRYRPAPWRWPEVVVVATGVAVLAAFLVLRGTEPLVLEPDLLAAPVVSVAALAAALLGLVALLAPPPPGADGGAR
jgi:energy-coupling factor transport system permease protein